MKRRILAIGAVLTVVAAGCSSSRGAAPATTSTGPPPTSTTTIPAPTTTLPNPDVIPPVITVAYVNAVFVVLNHLRGDAARSLVEGRKITPQALVDLRSIFNDPLYHAEVLAAQNDISDLSNVRIPPGDPLTTVTKLEASSPTCIFVETTTSLAAIEFHATATPASEYWEFNRKQAGDDPGRLNPTPWALSYNQDFLTPTVVADPCGKFS